MNADIPATVVLPCPPDQFRDFIAGLLGQAQTIEAWSEGAFEIDRPGIENLFHLIDQRISSQNEATLMQFTARVIFDDQSSVLLNSLEELLSYNEVRPLISTGLVLSWSFLIKFRNRKFPEKQVIVISFQVHQKDDYKRTPPQRPIFTNKTMPIGLRIEHTDRTWGTDLEALLRGQLALHRRPVGRARKFVNDHAVEIGFSTGVLFLVLALAATYKVSSWFAQAQLDRLALSVVDATANDLLDRKLTFLIDLVTSGVWTRFTLFAVILLLFFIIMAVVLGAFAGDQAEDHLPSFILLTKRSVAAKDASLARERYTWVNLAMTFATAMFLGVASNALFYLALKYLGLPS